MPFPGLWGRFNRILMVKKQRFSMWFLQWVSLANTVLPTEIIICRFDETTNQVDAVVMQRFVVNLN